jgi:polysaccharide pyruvyl transferase WcaK-like protein
MGKEKFLKVYSEVLNDVLRELKVPVLFVATQHHDVQISKELMDMVKSPAPKAIVSNVENNHYDIKAVLSKASLLSGMRVHSLILSTSELTPAVGIAYQPKCSYYFKSLGLSERMMEFKDFSHQSLLDLILRGWADRKAIKETLSQRIPFLKQEAHKAGELVAAMRREDDLDQVIAGFRETSQDKLTQQA